MELTSASVDEVDKAVLDEQRKKLEAALFVAGRFMKLSELVALTDINPILLRTLLEDLSEKYKDSGIAIIKREDLWKMDVSPDFNEIVNKFATGSAEFTNAEQETLAIISYKQPIKQSVIVRIRGNKAYDHIRKFVEMGLVNKKEMGHTAELRTTEQFDEYFHDTGHSENMKEIGARGSGATGSGGE